MRSRIFSSKYIKTVSKGQAWIPAFLTLGFILAFPVIGLEKLGSWRNLGYTQDQITLLYYRLWKDGFVLTGMAVAMAAGFMNAVNGFLYLYSRKKTDFYHSLPMKRSELFAEKAVMGLIYYLVPYIVIEFLTVCVGAARGLFSLEFMGMAVKMLIEAYNLPLELKYLPVIESALNPKAVSRVGATGLWQFMLPLFCL